MLIQHRASGCGLIRRALKFREHRIEWIENTGSVKEYIITVLWEHRIMGEASIPWEKISKE